MNRIKITFIALAIISIGYCQSNSKTVPKSKQNTICNPMNISYRFCLNEPSRREAADPAIVLFKDEYYLFASKSGGYWHSTDLMNWDFITSPDLPLEDYAPAVVVFKGALYFMASADSPVKIYKTSNPKTGNWQIANPAFPIGMTDPDLFADDDGHLYFYYGCSNVKPIYGVELDPNTLNPIGNPVECFNSDRDKFGWERNGDYNEKEGNPWIEGAWMTKHNGKYYLQYSGPGTEFKSYSDGVYMSDKPLGKFVLAPHNPCSYKPEGFINGAGHSSTFQDKFGNYWHVSSMTISVKHPFERRLGLFPMFFDKDGTLYTYTAFGDFPLVVPQKKINSPADLFPEWMLLSYNKPIEVSSSIADHPKENAVNEDIRTYWSAQTGNKGEWACIDLEKKCTINALQINFAENQTKLFGRDPKIYYQYVVEYSNDKKTWTTLIDDTQNKSDVPHNYIQFKAPVKARYIRLTNYYVPDGTFALSGLRVFGSNEGAIPTQTINFNVVRNQSDRCEVKLKWNKNIDAIGYNIRFGTQKDKLYHNYQVLKDDELTIRSLNSTQKYYFAIDTFNEKGVTKGNKIIEVE